ncbi:MAG: hypothetical protein J5I47_12275 [Vicingus serpentipes]|nr:hypothetical protein [Vicingus serpentipes]
MRKYDNYFIQLHEKASQIEGQASSFKAKSQLNNLNSLFYTYYGNNLEASKYSHKLYLLFEEHPIIKKYNVNGYNLAINNYAVSKLHMNDFEGAIKLFNQLDSKEVSNYEKMLVFQYKAGNQLSAHLALGNINSISTFIKEIEDGLLVYEKYLSDLFKVIILTNLSEYYFWAKNYRKAKRYTSNLLNEAYSEIRKDIIRFMYTFNLIISFESGDYDHLNYLLRSYQLNSKLKNKNILERWIESFIEEALKTTKLTASFYVNKELELLNFALKTESLKEGFDLKKFNFLIWIRMKTDTKSLKEIRYEFNTKDLTGYAKDRAKQLS